VERFLDTPIKRYSSGMKVRLAFSVAAHLEPDILVIDEVLAVGDAEFQQKCLGAMAGFGRGGRTVLFVSHNLSAVQALCGRGIVLQKGRMTFDGLADAAIEHYVRSTRSSAAASAEHGIPNGAFILKELSICGEANGQNTLVHAGGCCSVRVRIAGHTDHSSVVVTVWISGSFGERVLLLSSRLAGASIRGFSEGLACEIRVPQLMLMPGYYQLNVAVSLPAASVRGVVYAPADWVSSVDGA
jgi:lipopolysaccharide transport system ATP-binding protein